MAPVGSPRRALTNLPVNTSPLPPIMASSREDAGHLKRRIFRVDDPETPPASIRPRAYQLAQKDAMIIRKSETSSEDVEEVGTISSKS